MTSKRTDYEDANGRGVKRVKVESNGNSNSNSAKMESNPYLSHWNDESSSDLQSFKRHATTAQQAQAAEDGPQNPFNGKPLSNKYMSILKVRRNLPVHQQR